MSINFKFKGLSVVALLSCFIGITAEGSKETPKGIDSLAPEISAGDAKVAFRDIPKLEKGFIDSTPADRKDAIPVGELGIDGGNKDMIVKLAKEIADKKHGNFDSLLIAHKGKLIFESYYLRGRINSPHPQASARKAYTSLAIGRAIQLGYLTMDDLDKPAVSFLKKLDTTKLVEGSQTITLHKAMTMRSGIRINSEKIAEIKNENPDQLEGLGRIQTYLEYSRAISPESQRFHYQIRDPQLVMQVLDVVVPGSAKSFVKRELLDKMGITEYPKSSMTSRDMIKWGVLLANSGKWNGEQLISEAFIAKAINRIIHPREEEIFFVGDNVSNPGYGYYFWQADLKVGNKHYFSTSAQGGGGQYIIFIEELDLLVVTTGHDRELRPLRMTAERILPAFFPP